MSILNKTLKTMQTSKLSDAVSAYEEFQKKVTLSKGMNGHIAKLIDVKNMEEVLMSVLR